MQGVWDFRRRKGEAKRMRWWNEGVKCAVRKKKVLYRKLLDAAIVR